MAVKRYTVKDVAEQSGFSKDTIRRHADEGRIPCTRDINQWRVFSERSIKVAKKLAGVSELASSGDNASKQ